MQTSESSVRDFLRLIVWYPLRWLLIAMPVRFGMSILHHMGNLHFKVARGKQQLLLENLQRTGITLDGKVSAEHIRTYFQNHYLDQLFPIISQKFNNHNITKYLTIRGLSNLDEALLKEKGVILVHGHFGPVHLPLVALALMGYSMKQIGNPSADGLSWIGRNVAFRLRRLYEDRMPAGIIQTTSFLRPVFTALRHNDVIMTTGDGSGNENTFGKHARLTFLGQPVDLPLGPAILAQKTGASLLPLFIIPGTHTPFVICIGNEIFSPIPGRKGAIDCTHQFAIQLEKYIHSYPGYWHFLDRFEPNQIIET